MPIVQQFKTLNNLSYSVRKSDINADAYTATEPDVFTQVEDSKSINLQKEQTLDQLEFGDEPYKASLDLHRNHKSV